MITRKGEETGDVSKQPPTPIVSPDALVGHVVQIAMGGSDQGGSLPRIPPLRVTGWAFAKHNYATVGDAIPETCFLGVPMRGFIETGECDENMPPFTGVRFYSRMPLFQPHFLLSKEFLEYFQGNDYDVIPVEVYSTESEVGVDSDFIADERNFFYVGEGVLQLFIPGEGFQKGWPKRFPWQKELKETEEWLLSRTKEARKKRR